MMADIEVDSEEEGVAVVVFEAEDFVAEDAATAVVDINLAKN